MKSSGWEIPGLISSWFARLPKLTMDKAIPEPHRAGIFSTDMIVGFLYTGNLASERVARLATPVVRLFERAYRHGIRHFILFQDAHHEQAPEFGAFPTHSVRGSQESTTIPELKALPFSAEFTIFEKNSLHPALGTGFDDWLDRSQDIETAVVVGNCTDLCVYQLAMHLRLRANARDDANFRVIVPANAVETYDVDEAAAAKSGSYAHPGDFFHQVFLYHMALNGIEIIRELS